MSQTFPVQSLTLNQITADPDVQIRDGLDSDTVRRYADLLDDDAVWPFPPLVAFNDAVTGKIWLSEGFTRFEAAINAGRETVPVELRPGSRDDAREFAALSNAKHGQPLKSAERRKAIGRLLETPIWWGRSDRWIAKEVGASAPTVTDERAKLATAKNWQLPETVECEDSKRRPYRRRPRFADLFGHPIPDSIEPCFRCGLEVIRDAVMELFVKTVSNALTQTDVPIPDNLEERIADDATMGPAFSKALIEALEKFRPFAVCVTCHGEPDGGCPECAPKHGYLTFETWNRLDPSIRAKYREQQESVYGPPPLRRAA